MKTSTALTLLFLLSATPALSAPTGVILDIFDVQSDAFNTTSKRVLDTIMSDFRLRVQTAIAVSGDIPGDAFSSHQKAYSNRRLLIDKVNEAYGNLGEYAGVVNRLHDVVSLVDDAKALRTLSGDLKDIAGGLSSIKASSEELYDILKSEPELIAAFRSEDPQHFIDLLLSRNKNARVLQLLEDYADASGEVKDKGKRVWNTIRAYTQQSAALDYTKNLESEWGMKLFIQDTLVKTWRENDLLLNDDTISYFMESVEVLYPTRGLWGTTLSDDGALTAGSRYALLDSYQISSLQAETQAIFIPDEKPSYSPLQNTQPEVRVACEPPPCNPTPITPISTADHFGVIAGVDGANRYSDDRGFLLSQRSSPSNASIPAYAQGESINIETFGNDGVTKIPVGSGTVSANSGYLYSAWGEWNGTLLGVDSNTGASTRINRGFFVVGLPTTNSQMSGLQGTAIYSGALKGDYFSAQNGAVSSGAITGSTSLLADFGRRTLDGQFNMKLNNTLWANGTLNQTNLTTFGGTLNGFNTTFVQERDGQGNPASQGSAWGVFYGPQAQEMGGAFQYSRFGDGSAEGVWHASK